MSVQIRPMAASDKAPVMEFLRRLPEFTAEEVPVAEELIDAYLKDGTRSGYHIAVSGLGGRTVGYICYGPTPLTQGTWDLYWMATNPEEQGRGIGGGLLAFAEHEIRQAGGRLVLIETSSRLEYEKTRRFHSHHGYEKICQVPDFYAPGDHRLILGKKLTGLE